MTVTFIHLGLSFGEHILQVNLQIHYILFYPWIAQLINDPHHRHHHLLWTIIIIESEMDIMQMVTNLRIQDITQLYNKIIITLWIIYFIRLKIGTVPAFDVLISVQANWKTWCKITYETV